MEEAWLKGNQEVRRGVRQFVSAGVRVLDRTSSMGTRCEFTIKPSPRILGAARVVERINNDYCMGNVGVLGSDVSG